MSCLKVAEALSLTHSNVQKGVMEIMGGQVLDYEAKRIAKKAAEQSEISAIINMISFGVSEDKILSKYSKDTYDKALDQMKQAEEGLKEM